MNADDATWTAVAQLVVSREHLRVALRSDAQASRPAGGIMQAGWLDSLKTIPGAGVVIDAVHGWWSVHPLRHVGSVALATAQALIRPVAQRHPFGLVLASLALGGLFAWSRPWRWMLRPGLVGGLWPYLLTRTVAELPLQRWFATWAVLATPPSSGPP